VGRGVEPGEEVHFRAPGLADAMLSVRVAESEHEREAVFRFRYSVYVEELRRGVAAIDERRQWIRDPEDDDPRTLLLYTTAGDGEVTGTARLRAWPAGAVPDDVAQRFALGSFAGIDALGAAELGRVMLRSDLRGHGGLVALLSASYQLTQVELEADVVFLTCLTGLVRHYRQAGFRTYASHLVPTADGVTVPMVLVLFDRSYLDGVGSFLAPLVGAFYGSGKPAPVEIERWSGLFDADSAPVELDPAAVWEGVRSRHGASAAQHSFLGSFDTETMRKLSDRGLLMTVDAGQLLTKKGLVQGELFVVLDGTFEIHDGERLIRVVGPGEVMGEVGFFGTARQRSASITALSSGQLLVIRRHRLDELRQSDPGCAADILFELARALADRMYAPGS
jgi:predicted GNAT family N-acyltransferase